MDNREKVISTLEEIKTQTAEIGLDRAVIAHKFIDKILAMLKEQEAKQVIGIADSLDGMEVGYCPSCNKAIVNKKIDETKFCKFCGQKVNWNE